MNPDELKCPCMPMCPNYGKCRQCIAAHAAYYTVPKCIKLMQEKMKREHLHPSNPHLKKTCRSGSQTTMKRIPMQNCGLLPKP